MIKVFIRTLSLYSLVIIMFTKIVYSSCFLLIILLAISLIPWKYFEDKKQLHLLLMVNTLGTLINLRFYFQAVQQLKRYLVVYELNSLGLSISFRSSRSFHVSLFFPQEAGCTIVCSRNTFDFGMFCLCEEGYWFF